MQWVDGIPILALLRFALLLCLLYIFVYQRHTILLYFLICDCIVNCAFHFLRQSTAPASLVLIRDSYSYLLPTWNAIGLVLYGILANAYTHTPPRTRQHDTAHFLVFVIALILLKIVETTLLSLYTLTSDARYTALPT